MGMANWSTFPDCNAREDRVVLLGMASHRLAGHRGFTGDRAFVPFALTSAGSCPTPPLVSLWRVFERLADLESEYDVLEARLPDIYASGDQDATRTAGRRYAELKPIIEAFRELRSARTQLDEAKEMLRTDADTEMRELAREEVAEKESSVADLEGRLKVLLLPKDPNDDKNVILEVRGAEGGEEANLFAGDLMRMYQGYAAQQGWKIEVLTSQPSDMGGFKDATFLVKGAGVWSRLKHEAGTHRVQRVPVTESQGRIHTSAATVAVLPEAQEVDVTIDPNDLQIDVYRSTGPGGQSVNTTDSAVRVTHRPSGIVVACQDEKSQLQNKDKAMRILRARLLQAEQQRQADELSSARRAQVGGGGRSEKIRTYNFKENRVTDHRVGLTLHSLDHVLQGDLDQLVDALVEADRAAQLAGAAN
jgi:peptide chain release factor 1